MVTFKSNLGIFYCSVFLCFFTLALAVTDIQTQSRSDIYRAAVVEYQPVGNPSFDSGPAIISRNVGNYVTYISNASVNAADIIVFPEYGLTTLGVPRDRNAAKSFLVRVPEIGRNPCIEQQGSSQVQELSCAARSNKIYVVVNLGEIRQCNSSDSKCPNDGVHQYNTDVVFDRSGSIVAKYEKGNLYFENQFDKPDPIQLSTFQTDFGVTFGLITCFDIQFYTPTVELMEQGIKHFIFPTAWVDELPFLMAVQTQASWAFGSNSNLLASGYHQPLGGQLGSGIFSGENGAVTYVFDSDSGSVMLLGDLSINPSKRSKQGGGSGKSNIAAYHSYLREDLLNYTTKIINSESSYHKVCTENGFCCSLSYQVANNSNSNGENYRLIAFNGTRTVAAKTDQYDWQVCAVVRCLNDTLESCTENNKNPSAPLLTNFIKFHLQAQFDVRNGTKFLPMYNGIDIQYDLISPRSFSIQTDPASGLMRATSSSLSSVNVKTIALINKLFDV